jgi:hypothetical protein
MDAFIEVTKEFFKTIIVAYSVYNIIFLFLMRYYSVVHDNRESVWLKFIGSIIFLIGVSFDNSNSFTNDFLYLSIEILGISLVFLGNFIEAIKKEKFQ